MHPAEQMLRKDIEELTLERCATRRDKIKLDIKYAYWHGFINENLYIELTNKVIEKYNNLFEQTF